MQKKIDLNRMYKKAESKRHVSLELVEATHDQLAAAIAFSDKEGNDYVSYEIACLAVDRAVFTTVYLYEEQILRNKRESGGELAKLAPGIDPLGGGGCAGSLD